MLKQLWMIIQVVMADTFFWSLSTDKVYVLLITFFAAFSPFHMGYIFLVVYISKSFSHSQSSHRGTMIWQQSLSWSIISWQFHDRTAAFVNLLALRQLCPFSFTMLPILSTVLFDSHHCSISSLQLLKGSYCTLSFQLHVLHCTRFNFQSVAVSLPPMLDSCFEHPSVGVPPFCLLGLSFSQKCHTTLPSIQQQLLTRLFFTNCQVLPCIPGAQEFVT